MEGPMKNLFDPAGKVALVTGGTSGLGHAIAEAFLQNGVDVAVCSRHPESAPELAELAAAEGRRYLPVYCDITKEEDVEKMGDIIEKELGPVTMLVNSAGITRDGLVAAMREADFDAVIHDSEFLRHWGIPFESAEGFLYPDTYFMPQPRAMDPAAARAAAGRMVDTFWRKADALWPEGRPDPATLRRVVTLASIVEKETAVPAERSRVAGVYANRLKKNMLLQADPTVIYGLGPDFRGPLLTKHLQDGGNAYNTYRLAGLPPGPICSPGLAALRAALSPEVHNYLYFVANGKDGGHVFSTTLSQHNRAVRDYRNAIRGRNK